MHFGRYIVLYIESVASEENVSLLYYLAGKLKSIRDKTDTDAQGQISEVSPLVPPCYAKTDKRIE